MNILIVEDETLAAQKLARFIQQYNASFQIVNVLDSVEDTVQYLQSEHLPDLIFLDIHLADGNSFEIFKKIEVKIPIIFATAYDEYALSAFELNSVDYILKPIKQEQINRSLDKYFQLKESFQPQRIDYSQLAKMLRPQHHKTRFMVKYQNKIISLNTTEIACFFAEDGVTCILTFSQEKFVIDYTLDDLVDMLNPTDFFRVNRKYILSIHMISEVHPYFKGRLKVMTTPSLTDEVIISNQRANNFKEWLGK
ncbi:hypothetical protein BKI52_28335 [marine bacterium AO1-C]|nr:hypothetical protein BKI52_28335 [marine bacterium AO1-C]